MSRNSKRIFVFLLTAVIILCADLSVLAEVPEYTIIKTAAQLNAIRNNVDDDGKIIGKYKLGANIVFDGSEAFRPIGVTDTGTKPFIGELDGNGYTVKNIKYKSDRTNPTTMYLGLFGYNGGAIKNLTLENVTLEVGRCNYLKAGAIASQMSSMNGKGKIINCYVSGEFKLENPSVAYYSRIGGVVGDLAGGSITDTVSDVDIIYSTSKTDSVNAGGLVAECNGQINACANKGNISIKTQGSIYAGGVVGFVKNTETVIDSCYNLGDISCESQMDLCSGGIIGGMGTPVATVTADISNTVTAGKITPKAHFSSGFNAGMATVANGAVCGNFNGESNHNYYLDGTYTKASASTVTASKKTVEELRALDSLDFENVWYLPTDTEQLPALQAWKNISDLSVQYISELDKQYSALEITKLPELKAVYDEGSSEAAEKAIIPRLKIGENTLEVSFNGYKKSISYLGYISGDLDFNGEVSVTDLVSATDAIVTEADLGKAMVPAEMDNNGVLTVTDAVLIRKTILEQ